MKTVHNQQWTKRQILLIEHGLGHSFDEDSTRIITPRPDGIAFEVKATIESTINGKAVTLANWR